jgi:anti-sigma factor RsiW
MSCQYLESDRHAYVDGELDAESTAAFRDHLSGCTSCRRRTAEHDALGRLVRAAPYYPASEHLRARVSAQARRVRSVRRVLAWAAAAVLLLSAGAGISVLRAGVARGDAVADAVVDSHVRSLMANHLFDVQSTDQHAVKPWFLGKLDFSPPVVDLASIGFPLAGARLDYLTGRPVAALVYQRQKHSINLFISPARHAAVARWYARSNRGFHIRHWVDDSMSFWAVSDLNDAELSRFSRALGAP